jgi:membrane-bound serine protease (ClpP class)
MLASSLSDPNLAVVLLVLGAIGVFWEMHAPGMIVPGVLGLLLIAAAAYGLYENSATWYGLVLLLCAGLLLGIELKYYTHMISGIAGAVLFAFGSIVLLQGPQRVSPAVSIGVSIALGTIIVFLGSLGMRARKAKVLTGLQALVGETGTVKRALNPEGTVFVNGEYWQARSNHPIDAGQQVRVERVDEMTVWVTEV